MPGTPWTRRVVDALTDHIAYKLGAFVLALALWVAASGEEPASRYITVRFAPVLDSGVHMAGDTPKVRALVEGPAGELLKLYATPPVVRRAYGAEHDTMLHVELRPTDIDLPNGVSRLRVRDVQPHVVDVRLVSASRGAREPVAGPATVSAPPVVP